MAVYTHLDTQQIATHLRTHYDLAPLTQAEGILSGVENTNYRLSLADGTRLILTLYERRVTAPELPFFLGLLQHLAARGCAVAQPVARRNGDWFTSLADRPAALTHFLPGESLPSAQAANPAQLEAVGRVLAQLHRAADGFALTRPNALALAGWQAIAARLALLAHPMLHESAALIAQELQAQQRHAVAMAALPRGIIHGDLFPDNVFFHDDSLTGVIDFYFACADALAYDVAVTLVAWAMDDAGVLDVSRMRAVLTGYTSLRPLSAAEGEALPLLMRGAALRFLLTRLEAWVMPQAAAAAQQHDPRAFHHRLRTLCEPQTASRIAAATQDLRG